MLKKLFKFKRHNTKEKKVHHLKEESIESQKIVKKYDINTEKLTEDVIVGHTQEEKKIILEAKVKREKSIKSIDLYTGEEQLFNSHKECAKNLGLPIGYIKENLIYGYTDYLGNAINFLNKELGYESGKKHDYLYLSKSPLEQFKNLNNKIFTLKINESKRDKILSNSNIDPIKMHYKFECIDYDYDKYFETYKNIIKRGGKKKVDLVNQKGEVVEVFKSIEDCAKYLDKNKKEILDMLKYGDTKIKRYEIRYSLRKI